MERHELVVAIIAALVIVELLAQLFTRAKDEDFTEMLAGGGDKSLRSVVCRRARRVHHRDSSDREPEDNRSSRRSC